MEKKPDWLLFDVYETLLDMQEMERRVNIMLNSKRGYQIWFGLLMQYSFIDNCIGEFHPFTSISKATLQMAGKSLGIAVKDDMADDIIFLMKQLPLQEGVTKGLSRLSDAGFRLAALTNAPGALVKERMERTGLISYFENLLSAEEMGRYKPTKDVYQWAARKLSTMPENCMMVTAHSWDVSGAAAAGLQTAYVQRPGAMMYPLAPSPSLTVKDLVQLAEELSL